MVFITSYSIGRCHSLDTKYAKLQSDIQSQIYITKSLEKDKENLLIVNSDLADKLILATTPNFDYIEPLKEYDKQAYIIAYMEMIKSIEDPPEQPQDVMSAEEYDVFCRIVEQEISNGTFDEKVNIVSCIINRYNSEIFPSDWMELFTQKVNGVYQFSSYGDGRYKEVTVSESTINAINYAYMIENTAQGCTYFRSGTDNTCWHDTSDKLERVFNDTKHTYYKLKEETN